MSIGGMRSGAGWAALLALTCAPLGAAFAGDGQAWPSGAMTPLELPPPTSQAARQVDYAPIAALKPQALASMRRRSLLDLPSPAGFAAELPPDTPLPVVSISARTAGEPNRNAALSDAKASPDMAPAAIAATPEPALTPAAVAPSPEPASPTEALAADVHAAVDRLLTIKPANGPIGAGDWVTARQAIASVYAERAYAPLWVEDDHFGSRARAVLDRLARASEDGLDLAALPVPAADWRDASPAAQADADVALSSALVAYALQASGARINPRGLSKDVTAKPEVADPAAALKSISVAADPDAALAAFNPPQRGYRALRNELALLLAPTQAPLARWAPGPILKLGMSDPRVPLIRARFGLGALTDPTSSEVYDIRVASAVAAFQRVHGLQPSGALTEATASAIQGRGVNTHRERLLIANMEMWRWEPRDMGEIRVEVNVPDFSLKLMNGDSVVHRARVIVGKPDTPTPIFSNSIKYMLFNPVWHVPDSIVKKELAPHLSSDPNYLARRGYKVSYAGDKLVVEQPPGEANALGRMLFLFPNEHAVYLHDTPMRSLFATSYRALSHGCVRVEEPARLAEIVMGGAARGWTEAKVNSLLGDKERTYPLPTPVPVHLQYFTEFVDETGSLRERDDLYGLTGKVVAALANSR